MKISSYLTDKDRLSEFISTFEKQNEKNISIHPYMDDISKLAKRELSSFNVSMSDLEQFDVELARSCLNNTNRYRSIIYDVVDELLNQARNQRLNEENANPTEAHVVKDILDVYIQHRLMMNQQIHNERELNNDNTAVKQFPPELIRRYDVFFRNDLSDKTTSIRDVKAHSIGKLVKISGILIRTSDVKPHLKICTYTCDKCGAETYQEINNTSFMPLFSCQSEYCIVNHTGGRLYLQTRASKFVKYQEIVVQEHANEVPVGCIPRSITIHCVGDLTRICQPGDIVVVTGTFLPILRVDNKSKSYGLLNETFIDAHSITKVNNEDDIIQDESNLTQEEMELFSSPDFYERLAQSIAPEIFGHQDIKKILLLLLVGSVDVSPNGMKIRGSINVCLMGDPGVAKSQMLLFIARLATRSQYATGRGSSGVGLTASIVKDTMTGEMTLEGGSLVLADQGVCCIDEFDKMMDNDRTAIHEAMEQQTISIAKAGINTTLNARVSILAAANPSQGRYNPKKSVEANVDLPAALLSRFDILWLMRDMANNDTDLALANHIAYVHQHSKQPDLNFEPISIPLMRKYISLCKKKTPIINPSLSNFLTQAYVEMRKEARNNAEAHGYTSARSLLGLIRISIALAKLRLSDEVSQSDVCEAMRLMEKSKASRNEGLDNMGKRKNESHLVKIFSFIRDMPTTEDRSIKISDIRSASTAKGFTPAQVNECLSQYELLNVWIVHSDKIEFI